MTNKKSYREVLRSVGYISEKAYSQT